MRTTRVKVEWDLDGVSPEEAGVSNIVEVPMTLYLRGDNDVSEYLSDTYGWLVLGWCDYEDKDEEEYDEYAETVLQEGRRE